jgi:hypothetical protein
MPQTALPNIGVNFEYTLGTNDWKNGFDSSMVILDSSAQAFVIDQRTAEPVGPAVGDTYLLGPGTPTGTNWAGDTGGIADALAVFTNVPGQTDGSPWFYIQPRDGFQVYDRTLDRPWIFINGVWTPGALDRKFEKLEIGATHTTELEDAGRLLTLDDASTPVLLTIATFASVPLPLGVIYEVLYLGTGFLEVRGATGVSIRFAGYDETAAGVGARPTFELNEHFKLWHIASDVWILFPDPRQPTIEVVTAASFEPIMRNRDGTIILDNAAMALNIPDQATVPYPIGTELEFLEVNGAAVTVTDDVAVVWRAGSQNLVVAGIAANSRAHIRKVASDTWFVLLNQVLPT